MVKQEVSVRTISLPSLLGIVFVVLKLCGVIAWPWLWVLAPFWIPLVFVIFVLLFIAFAMLFEHVSERKGRRKN